VNNLERAEGGPTAGMARVQPQKLGLGVGCLQCGEIPWCLLPPWDVRTFKIQRWSSTFLLATSWWRCPSDLQGSTLFQETVRRWVYSLQKGFVFSLQTCMSSSNFARVHVQTM